MFTAAYFAPRYFAATFWAKVGATATWATVLKDVTTVFATYLKTLAGDVTSALRPQLATWRAADPDGRDLTTVIARALS